MLLLGTSGKTTAIFFTPLPPFSSILYLKNKIKKKNQELSSATMGTQPLCAVYQKDELG